MIKVTFEAETDTELFLMVENYRKGFLQNNYNLSEDKIKEIIIKRRILELNPIGKLLKSNSNSYKHYPIGKEYPILDIKVSVVYRNRSWSSVLLKGEDGKTTWKSTDKFIGFIDYTI